MKKVLYATYASVASLLLPATAFAVTTTPGASNFTSTPGIGRIATLLQSFLDYAVPTLISIAVIYFLYGVVKYVITSDSEEGKEAAKHTIIYGIIGIVVMVSVYGIVRLVQQTLTVDQNNDLITPPTLPLSR